MKKTMIQLETLTCPSCIRRIEGTMGKQKGVSSVEVKFNASKVEILYDPTITSSDDLGHTISNLGYKILEIK